MKLKAIYQIIVVFLFFYTTIADADVHITYIAFVDPSLGFYKVIDSTTHKPAQYIERVLTMNQGDNVIWKNDADPSSAITIISKQKLFQDAKLKLFGDVFSYTFDQAGIFTFYMGERDIAKQTIIVNGNSVVNTPIITSTPIIRNTSTIVPAIVVTTTPIRTSTPIAKPVLTTFPNPNPSNPNPPNPNPNPPNLDPPLLILPIFLLIIVGIIAYKRKKPKKNKQESKIGEKAILNDIAKSLKEINKDNPNKKKPNCLYCNSPLPFDAEFCPRCGKRQDALCLHCREPLPTGADFCPSCGNKIMR